jgi:hypothetical protein
LKFHYFSKRGQKSVGHFQGGGRSGQGSTMPSGSADPYQQAPWGHSLQQRWDLARPSDSPDDA